MPIIRFEKEDDKQHYWDWRKLNHQGFVLNINSWNSKSMTIKNIIHSANRYFVGHSASSQPRPTYYF